MSDIGRACTTCRHPARAAIEDALASGRSSIRGIARHWEIDAESLRRHVRNHLDPVVQEALRAVPGASALGIAERMLAIADDAHAVRIDALNAGERTAASRAGDAELRALTALANRLGVRSGDALRELDDAATLATAVARAARRDPDVGESLARILETLDRPDLAAVLRRVPAQREALSA